MIESLNRQDTGSYRTHTHRQQGPHEISAKSLVPSRKCDLKEPYGGGGQIHAGGRLPRTGLFERTYIIT